MTDSGGTLPLDLDPTFATDAELAAISVEDADADPTNEENISLELNGTSIELTDSGGTLPLDLDPVFATDAEIIALGAGTNLSNTDLVQNANRDYSLAGFNLVFSGAGSIGIGTSNPQNKLHVLGEVRSSGYSNSNGTESEPSYAFSNDSSTGMWRGPNTNFLRFSTGGTEAITIDPSQNVGIGVITPTERLHVNGNILATGTITPDYVFQKYFQGYAPENPEYRLMNLKEIRNFIQSNNHLPGVPSAGDVKLKGGILINRATEINLEKIEELFLYTIEQEDKIEALQKENADLSSELETLKERMSRIEYLLLQKKEE